MRPRHVSLVAALTASLAVAAIALADQPAPHEPEGQAAQAGKKRGLPGPRGPRGPRGAQGPTGATGPVGPAGRRAAADILFARVTSNAQLLAGRGVVSVARIDDPTFENYGVTFNRDIRNCIWSVSLLGGSAPSAPGLTVVGGTVNTIRVDEGDTPDGGQGFILHVIC